MAKHEPAYFDSQASAAAALKIDVYRLRDAKAEGCTAFRSGRVYRDELLAWFEEKRWRRQESEPKAAEKERQTIAANTILWLMKCANADLLTQEQFFETCRTIAEKDTSILNQFIAAMFTFLNDNFAELRDAHAAHPKIVDWLCEQGGVKYGRPQKKRATRIAKNDTRVASKR